MIDIKNQIAVLTGASGGIGRAIALKLAQQKVRLCLVGRDVAKLEKQKVLLLKHTSDVLIIKADITKKKDIDELTSKVLNKFGYLNILVHNAGFLLLETIETSSMVNLDMHYKVNFLAPYLITKSFLPSIKEQQGQIVFLNSSAIQRAIPSLAQYSSMKHALKGFVDTLREEINSFGARVISIYPGQTATSMQQSIYKQKGNIYQPERLLQPEDIADVITHSLMLSSTAEITDIYMRPLLKSK